INHLTIQFPEQEVPAVAGISFSIRRGEIFALVGESGSGKSLTALSLVSLLPKQAAVSGSVSAFLPVKQDLLHLPAKKLASIRGREIAMIFQEPMSSLNPVMSCGNQVREAVELHTTHKGEKVLEIVKDLFTQVELPATSAMLNRYPHQLSGGQRQRVMIAMAMAGGPKLLIADEPTTALDVKVQKNILVLLKKLQREKGLSLLLITHDMGIVAHMADRVAVMHKGRIVETGETKDVLNAPTHSYTKGLLACRVTADKKGKRLPSLLAGSDDDAQIVPPMAGDRIFVEVKNLTVEYQPGRMMFGSRPPAFTAVDNVSFNILEKEFVGLVGESGSGKSTLGRALLHLEKPTSG
ncbi:MAG: ABC transporter ATP-binding protein, partial [Sphingobacteriales bacterium]